MVIPTKFANPISIPLRINTVAQLAPPSLEHKDSYQPPKKVKWSGRVKVVPGEGKRVTVESDFQNLALYYAADMVE